MIFGDAEVGKTTLAFIVARAMDAHFISFSAVPSRVKEIRAVIDQAKEPVKCHHKKTVLFVDERHRFNKGPAGRILAPAWKMARLLRFAPRRNRSFEVNAPLLSTLQGVNGGTTQRRPHQDHWVKRPAGQGAWAWTHKR